MSLQKVTYRMCHKTSDKLQVIFSCLILNDNRRIQKDLI
jgi:hypothetical protein